MCTDANESYRNPWTRLRVSVSFGGYDGEGKLSLACILKNSPPRCITQSRSGQRSTSSQHTIRSAAAKNAEVQELRRRLQGARGIMERWEDAGESVTDELFWRWLRSKGSLQEAEACLLKHAEWRIQLGRISEVDIRSELDAKKTFLQGCDNHGRPVIVVIAARHVIRQRNLEETKKLITYTLENAIASSSPVQNALGQVLCIFDLSGLGFANLDTKALQAVFEVLQQHFPESLSELWFLNAPFIFWGLWKMVSPFIQPATKQKIKFLSGRRRAQMLEDNVPQQVLPACYGGKADLISIEKAVEDLACSLSDRRSSLAANTYNAANQGRFAILRRIGGQSTLRSWHFIKDHNPVWAAKIFGQGMRRLGSALPRRSWQRRHPALSRHASAVSVHVRKAWNNRPSMPRPHYRLKQSQEERAHMQYIDVASFYILAILSVIMTVLYLKGMTGLVTLGSAAPHMAEMFAISQ